MSTLALSVASRIVEYPLAFQLAVGPPPGVYEIVARHSDKCSSIRGTSLNDGAAAVQWACVGEQNQRWSFEPLADGYYHIVSRHGGKALEVADASLRNNAPIIQNSLHDGGPSAIPLRAGRGWLLPADRPAQRKGRGGGGRLD